MAIKPSTEKITEIPSYGRHRVAAAVITTASIAIAILGAVSFISCKHLIHVKLLEETFGFDGSITLMAVGGGIGICGMGIIIGMRIHRNSLIEKVELPVRIKHWSEQMHGNQHLKGEFLKIAEKFSPPSSSQHILFFVAHGTTSDLFFGPAGHFEEETLKTRLMNAKKVIIIVKPNDDEARRRWEDGNCEDYWKMLKNSSEQKGMREFQEKVPHKLIVLSANEEAEINGVLDGRWDCWVPKRIKKALQFQS